MGMAVEQVGIFFGAVLLGAIFALVYDLLVVLRRALVLPNGIISALDLLYSLGIGLVSFLYMLATSFGRVRVFILLGLLLGALLHRLLLSRFVQGLGVWLLQLLLAAVIRPLCRLLHSCGELGVRFWHWLHTRLKKREKPTNQV